MHLPFPMGLNTIVRSIVRGSEDIVSALETPAARCGRRDEGETCP